jgi:tetratricopeptide (TPR) repeat protein
MHAHVDDPVKKAAELAALGRERMGAGDYGNAASLLIAALDTDPDCYAALLNLGCVEAKYDRWAAAAALARRACAIKPDEVGSLTNYGLYLIQLQRFDEADEVLTRAVERAPDDLAARHNLGLLRYNQNRPDEAISELRRAIVAYDRAGKNCTGARSDLSMATMKSGRLHEGLGLNEVRWEGMISKLPAWECGLPLWEGDMHPGQTLLLHSEQGYGDALQFVRFAQEIKEAGCFEKTIFAAPGATVRLLRGDDYENLGGQCGCDEVVDMLNFGEMVKASRTADCHAPLLSAVYRIGAEFSGQPASAEPYLRPVSSPAGRRTTVVGAGFRVGLVWAASPGHRRSRERSVPVDQLVELATVPGVHLYSLQVGPYQEDLQRAGVSDIVTDLAPQIEDFGDTVALAKQLDLVVTVDTGPLHAVAAAGVSTWLVQPFCPCWRWALGAKLWYGCVDEYHQEKPGSWSRPIREMTRDLHKLVQERRR